MSETLKRCPFCGSGDVSVSTGYHGDISMDLPGRYVECEACASCSDLFDADADAIAAWNRRAEPVPEPHREDSEASLYKIAAKADPSHAWHIPTPDGVCRRCGYDATDPEAREPCRGAHLTVDVEALVDELREAAFVMENNPRCNASDYSELTDRAATALRSRQEPEPEPDATIADRYRQRFPGIIEAWDRLWAYVSHRAYGPGKDKQEESRAQEWGTTALRLNKVRQKLEYLMDCEMAGGARNLPSPLGPVEPEPVAAPIPRVVPDWMLIRWARNGAVEVAPHNPDATLYGILARRVEELTPAPPVAPREP